MAGGQDSEDHRRFWTHVLCLSAIVGFTVVLFVYTVEIRSPWFGVLAESHHQYMSAHTMKDAKSWYREGPWTLYFGSFDNPRSIEFPILSSRGVYATYPPGYIWPIYLLGVVGRHEPTVAMLMNYNLANHFLIALFLSLTVFLFLRQLELSFSVSLVFSLIPMLLELLLPGPIYWHQATFFADQAILLPFVLFLFLEVLRYQATGWSQKTLLNLSQSAILLYGFLTDWLFVFVAAVVFCKRVLEGELGSSVRSFITGSLAYWSAPAVALSLYGVQLYLLNGFSQLKAKFFWRSSFLKSQVPLDLDPAKSFSFADVFWGHHVPYSFGKAAVPLLWYVLVLVLVAAAILGCRALLTGRGVSVPVRRTLWLTAMFLLPCFLQVYVLKQHSLIHLFSALKFSLPLAVVPLVLAPVLILLILEDLAPAILPNAASHRDWMRRTGLPATAGLCLFLTVAYVYGEHSRFSDLFPRPNLAFEVVGGFIDRNTGWRDVIFSPHAEVPERPPEWLSYTMKRIYRIRSVDDLYRRIRPIKGDYVVNIFVIDEYSGRIPQDIRSLISGAESVRAEGSLKLYKISGRHLRAGSRSESP
jgi:hypothetical protein